MKSNRGLTIEREAELVFDSLKELMKAEKAIDDDDSIDFFYSELRGMNDQIDYFKAEFGEKAPFITKMISDYFTYICICELELPIDYPKVI